MSDVHTILIDDARHALLREITAVLGRNDLHEAFAAWLAPGVVPGLAIDGAANLAITATGAERHFSHVGVLALTAQIRSLNDREKQSLISGLKWLINREPIVGGTPMGFCMDGVALAAVILAAKTAGNAGDWVKTCEWLQRCREATEAGQGLGVWQEWLLGSVSKHTGSVWGIKAEDGPEAAEVRVALRSKGIGTNAAASTIEQDEAEALGLIRKQPSVGIGVSRAAIRLAALDWIRRTRPVCDLRAVTVADIGALLRRFPSGLKKWTWEEKPRTRTSAEARRWHVENEYHVQNMLWLLLAPLLPDLIDEDATPKVGPVQPRADIGIPSMRLIVEAKFMRVNDSPKKIVEEIAEDCSLYLVPGSKYDRIIPFIWDDSRRTEHHEEIIRGLRQIVGIADAIIVARPGRMVVAGNAPGSC